MEISAMMSVVWLYVYGDPGMMSVVWLHAAPERHHRYDAKDGMVPKKELRAVFKSLRIRAKSVFATDSMVLIERRNCQLSRQVCAGSIFCIIPFWNVCMYIYIYI